MESICIFNNKGGVGKTTLLCNLSASLKFHHGKSVLVIDADPQCNATSYLLDEKKIDIIYSERNPNTIFSLLEPFKKGRSDLDIDLPILYSEGFNVDLIPGDPRFSLADDFLAREWFDACGGEERGIRSTLFFDFILSKLEKYDFVIIDVGPSLGAVNRAVLLASDYFLVPMSSDIFSLQALSNIRISLEEWREDIKDGIKKLKRRDELSEYGNRDFNLKTRFAGYVTQQYTAKSVEGVRVPVNAYEKIIKKIPKRIKSNLTDKFAKRPEKLNAKVGEIPYLQSLIPLSQISKKPIFLLKSKDGVVGSHFAKVKEFDSFIEELSRSLLENLEGQND